MAEDHADVIALRALGWLAGDDALWQRFAAATGAGAVALAHGADIDRATLAAVLEFVLQDDARVLAFAADAGVAPEAPMRAWQKLGGGGVHWT